MADGVAIGPGAESVGVLLWAANPDAARWGRSTWGGATWSAPAWQSVGCDVVEAQAKWGSSQEAGILSIAEASELDVTTHDPLRRLDPLNTASPYYGAIKPGTPIRLVGYATTPGYAAGVAMGAAAGTPAELPASAPYTVGQRFRPLVDGRIAAVRYWSGGVTGTVAVSLWTDAGAQIASASDAPAGATGWRRVALPVPVAVTAGTVLRCAYAAPAGQPFAHDYAVLVSASPSLEAIGAGVYGGGVDVFPSAAGDGWYRADVELEAAVLVAAEIVAGTGYIDEISHDLASSRGRIRAIGGIAYLAQAQLPIGVVLPNTLRARVRAIVAAVGLATITPVEPEAPTDPDVDPPVAPYDNTQTRPAWAVISDAATDALWYVWADPTGTIRFRSWGALLDAPISVGCPPADADPADVWLEGISTIEATAAGDAIRNTVRAYSAGTTWQPARTDPISIRTYGPRPFDVERVVPDFATWADRILADRADAGLDVAVGELRPYTEAELAALLETSLAGPAIIRVRDDAHGELVDLDVGMIGARVGVTPRGWRFGLATLVSRVAWDDITPEPPEPPIPPPDPWHVETRTYIATSDALIALTSGGAKYGAGAASSLPVGVWSGWTYRALLAFPAIPWTKVRALRTATLKLQSSTQVRVGFGSSPKTDVRRITSAWSAGSASSPSGSNAVVWPGPNTTTSGAVTSSLPTSEGAAKSIAVTALARAWAPTSAGGSGAAQYGLELREYSGSGTNTGEVWPVEKGGAARPTLELVVEVFD